MNEGFLKKQAAWFEGLFVLMDVLIIVFCFIFIHRITEGDFSLKLEFVWIIQATVVTTYLIFRVGGVYDSSRGKSKAEEIWRLLVSWSLVLLVVGLFAFLSKSGEVVSRIWFGFSTLAAFIGMSGLRIFLRLILNQLRSLGFNSRSIVLVGEHELAVRTISRLDANEWIGLNLEGVFLYSGGTAGIISSAKNYHAMYKNLGSVNELHGYLEQRRVNGLPIDQVWITLPLKAEETTKAILSQLKDSSVEVCIVPDWFGMTLLKGAVDEIGGIPLISLSNVRITSVGTVLKSSMDRLLALIAVTIISPLLLIIFLLVKFDSKGPVIFKQNRYGIDGRVIKVFKFRTMRVTENDGKVIQASRNDPRVTALGSKLRKLSLDELPQLFNVLIGNMSLVGPRPHAVSHNEEYRGKIEGYMMRHKMKPGITGWAQVNGWRGQTDTLEKMRKRIEHDIYYLENWSIWFDIKILWLTVWRGFQTKDVY